MSAFSAFRYDGKRALVVGGASGMGAAVAELVQDAGAEVVVMDFADSNLPGAKAIHVDLGDQASIDAALEECVGPVDALFSSAGVADGTPNIEKINFIGHRYLIDRLLERGDLGPRRGHRVHLLRGRARLGGEPRAPERVPRHRRLRCRFAVGAGTRQGRLLLEQAGDLRLRRAGVDVIAPAGDPDQRDLSRPDRHPARAGQQGHVARVRGRLPRSGGSRSGNPARAGIPVGVPLQRRGGRDHRPDPGHRLGLLQRRGDGDVPAATPAVNFLLGRYDA